MLREFLAGIGTLGRGFALWARSPRLMLTGALPALIVSLIYATAVVVLAVNSTALAAWLTPFANGWDEPWRTAFRVSAAVALVAVTVLIIVLTFAAVTLAVGDPFYERIAIAVEQDLGEAPTDPQDGFWRALARGLTSGLRILALSIAVALLVLTVGLVPVVGPMASPVLAAVFGGWMLALELTGFAFDARGLSLRDRRRMLGASRARTLGFGVAGYLLFLIPFAAVVVMPAAVAGATVLARGALARTRTGRHPEG